MNTRSCGNKDLQHYPEITRQDRILRQQAKKAKEALRQLPFSLEPSFSESESEEEEEMVENRMLKQLANHEIIQQPLCISFPELNNNVTFELKSGLIHLLPSFHGHAGFGKRLALLLTVWIHYYMGKLAAGTSEQVKPCRICGTSDHTTDNCRILGDEIDAHANVVGTGNFQGRKYDPYSNTYNPGWRDHPNLRNVSSMTLRSGKQLEEPKLTEHALEKEKEGELSTDEHTPDKSEVNYPISISVKANMLTFPSRVDRKFKEDKEKQILEVFRKVEINIPLLDAIKQIPRYAKFLKDLCSNKRKLKGNEKVIIGENVSAIIQNKLPLKLKDPDPLKETGVIIQLADHSYAYPDGLIEDVLVQIKELVFPADFYVLNMNGDSSAPTPILLGRPFLNTSQTKIDVREGTLTMEFDGQVIKHNIYGTMKYPADVSSVFQISIIDPLVQEVFELNCRDELEVALTHNLEVDEDELFEMNNELVETVPALQASKPYVPRHEVTDDLVKKVEVRKMLTSG
ncbi:hypothetical protein C2S53_018002 [Perilla frutescens var. hirtella]|uniref:Uncharacterized protein n=1 Tax=Perilla frutescens var. hirtella TaxID=608512 RepID=A0AAD4PCI1_PERFH|nr:hypothetical protein C2S53_018002 [Perilla frutescens var. hirtella]